MKKLWKFIFIFGLFAYLFSLTSCVNQTPPDDNTDIPPSEHVHSLLKYAESKPKCEIDGHEQYYKCTSCNKCYLDENATTEIDPKTLIIPALTHDYSIYREDSISYWNSCSHCGLADNSSRKPLDPNFVLPDISVIDQIIEIGVGYRGTIPINSDEEYTVISWDERIAKMEMCYNFNTSNGYLIYGMQEGEVIFSTVSKSGKTITNHKIIVYEDDTTYLGKGTLIKDLTIDNTDATVYVDDTLVTYTITTTADVDKIELSQIAANNYGFDGYYYDKIVYYEKYKPNYITTLDTLVIDSDNLSESLIDKEHGTKYSATRMINGDEAIWIIKWDLGYTAVKYVRISATNSKTQASQTSYAHLNIVYPKFGTTEEDFIKLLDYFIKTNSTSAILFESTLDFNLENAGYYGYYNEFDKIRSLSQFSEKFTNTVVFGGNTTNELTSYAIILEYSLNNMNESGFLNGKNVLCQANNYEKATLGFYYPLNDEFRALWAYLHNYEIDKEKFYYAHNILEKATAVIDQIITKDMTDFEKEKAIYTWLYEHGDALSKDPSKIQTPPDDIPTEIIQKTSYGIFNNYGGDCMAYSGAFHLLCNMVGVECVTVDLSTITVGGATEEPNINHRANVVRIDNEYYFVESFWSWQKSDDSIGTYRYLNMNYKTASNIYGWNLIENGGPSNYDYSSYLVNEYTGELLNK